MIWCAQMIVGKSGNSRMLLKRYESGQREIHQNLTKGRKKPHQNLESQEAFKRRRKRYIQDHAFIVTTVNTNL